MKRSLLLCLITVFTALMLHNQYVTKAYEDVTLTIYAASSLTDAFSELSEAFHEEYNIEVVLNFAGSSTLAAQIEQGAAADVFASANTEQMERLVSGGFIDDDTAIVFAENQLVIIVPFDNPAGITTVSDLAQDDILLVLAAQSVPIRTYTDELLLSLEAVYGEGFVDDVLTNVVSEESNVRQVVARVALGEADAAIVYRTDVTPELVEQLAIIELPSTIESPIAQYLIAPLSMTKHPEATNDFIAFLTSDVAEEILQSWHFCIPQPEEPLPESTPEIDLVNDLEDGEEAGTCG